MQSDKPLICPFKICIDTAETHYYPFQGMRADADQQHRPIIIETEFRCLQRFPESLGDYAPDCGIGRCHVERKSLEDCQGTILGFDGRRERFESELANLAAIESGVIVVECTFPELLANAPSRGKRTAQQNAKTLNRSVLAYIQDYKVPWLFCGSRRLAEHEAFRWMWRWYWKVKAEEESEMKEAAKRRRELLPATATQVLSQPLADSFDLSSI